MLCSTIESIYTIDHCNLFDSSFLSFLFFLHSSHFHSTLFDSSILGAHRNPFCPLQCSYRTSYPAPVQGIHPVPLLLLPLLGRLLERFEYVYCLFCDTSILSHVCSIFYSVFDMFLFPFVQCLRYFCFLFCFCPMCILLCIGCFFLSI